jgi:hypothetical protein
MVCSTHTGRLDFVNPASVLPKNKEMMVPKKKKKKERN